MIRSTYLLMVMVLVALIPTAALGTQSPHGGNFMVSVAGTAVGSTPHQIDLKITQLPGGQLSQVTGFVVGPEDVVQVKQGENIMVSMSPDLQVHKVTAKNVQGITVDLAPLPNNIWSLQGLLPGIYTLNVNVFMSSSGFMGTYETLLAILEPDQQPLPPAMIISQITVEEGAVCPPNLILVDRNCTEPRPPSPTPGPVTKPTDDCNDPSTPRTMCPFGPFWNEEEDVQETENADADEDISPEFSGDEDDTPEPEESMEEEEEEESAEDEDESAGADDNGSSQGGMEEDSQFG